MMFADAIQVMDFEGSRQSGVVEFGVVTLRQGRIEGVETRICAATGTISDADRRQHGLGEAAVADHPPFQSYWEYFAGLRERGPFCAHNAAVEDGLLRAVWPYPRRSPDFSGRAGTVLSWGPWLDTLAVYRSLYPDLASHKLEALVERFALGARLDEAAAVYCPPDRDRYHCALYDSLASAFLLLQLWDEPSLSGIGLEWLMAESAASGKARDDRRQGRLF